MPQFQTKSFQTIATKASETDMYGDMIAALQPFCGDIVLLDTHAHEDPDSGVFLGRRIKPDISFYDKSNMPASGDNPTNAKTMLGFMEFKNNPDDEPFSADGTTDFERDVAKARDTRGQIAVYNTSISASQFRTRVFSVFINKSTCRLMCAARCGTFVTESFHYTKDPSLATFFWRLSHSSPETRGIDTTCTRVTGTSVEIAEARQALDLSVTAPLYKVSVVDEVSAEPSYYLVSDPFTTSHHSPTGRCSRCFRAYDLKRKRVVLLKDNWRVLGYDAEGKTYRDLNLKKIQNIPQLVTAGDVLQSPGWKCGDEPFLEDQQRRVHYHYRLVLDTVGHSLDHFKSTWGLVNAILDAMIAHQEAFQADRLHRDISVGNIIITDAGKGMLIDWELSKRLDQRSYEKTGTWQFRSVRMLEANIENPVEHSVGDDVESFLWVLSWVVVRNAPSSMTDEIRADFLETFDQRFAAGRAKKRLLQTGATTFRQMEIDTLQVKNLLAKLWSHFGGRYGSELFAMMKKRSEADADQWLQQLETHDWMVGELKAALVDEEWENLSDASVSHQVIITRKTQTENQKKRKSVMTEYGQDPGL